MNLLTLFQTLKSSMAFLLLPLLAVMSISWVNSAPPANDSTKNSVNMTFPTIVALTDGGMARQGQVLALGTTCATAISLPELNQIDMSWIQRGMTLHLYEITGNTSIEAMVQQINNLALDCVASPNSLVYLSQGSSSWGSPHDGYGANADLPDIQQQAAFSIINPSVSVTGAGVSVVMFDSYCQGTSQNYLQNSGFGSINYQGDYTTQIPAIFESQGPPPNLCGHGEGVASMLWTIAPDVNIELYRVLGNNGFGTLDGLLEAINDFTQHHSTSKTIINLSLGVKGNSPILESVLDEVRKKDALIIAAAGNEAQGAPTQYPATYPFVIAAAASDGSGNLAFYANQGDVLAPGGDGDCQSESPKCLAVLNSQAESGAAYWKGSSFSAGMVSGLAALLLQLNPTLDPTEVKSLIQDGVNPSNNVIDIGNTLNLCVTSGPCQ